MYFFPETSYFSFCHFSWRFAVNRFFFFVDVRQPKEEGDGGAKPGGQPQRECRGAAENRAHQHRQGAQDCGVVLSLAP